MTPKFAPDIAAVVAILASARARRLASEAEGGSTVTRADDVTRPRLPHRTGRKSGLRKAS